MYGGDFGYSITADSSTPPPIVVQAAAWGDLHKIQRLLQEAINLDENPPKPAFQEKCCFPECKKDNAPLKSICKSCGEVAYCGD